MVELFKECPIKCLKHEMMKFPNCVGKYFHEWINVKSTKFRGRDLPLLGAKYKLAPSTVIPTSKYVAENTQFTGNCVPSSS